MRIEILCLAITLVACETSDPTFAVIENRTLMPVYQGWWSVTLFTTPVAANAVSDPQRTITSTDTAYALLAPGWDPTSTTPPAKLIPLMSTQELHVKRGDTLHIVVSDDAMIGNCAAGKPLSQDQADFITERIFPGPFAGMTYDAATCVTTPIASGDAGLEAGD